MYSKAKTRGKRGVLPLSWHLRKDDKDLIEEAWDYELHKSLDKNNCKQVLDFVGQP